MTLCRECLTFGDCLLPHQEIIMKIAVTHRQMGQGFRWQNVDVTAPKFANAVLQEDVWRDEKLSEEQRESLSETADKLLENPAGIAGEIQRGTRQRETVT